MRAEMSMVEEFHRKHRFPVGVGVGVDPVLDLLRIHLIVEEGVAELALALAQKNRLKVADALADLQYVLFGTAVAYGLPLPELFMEVHRSNMTKAVRAPGDLRLRDKGPDYDPPDLQRVLDEHDLKIHGMI